MSIKAPEGTRDLLPEEAHFWKEFVACAQEIFGYCGYVPIDTPIMEQTELFVRGIGEATDVVSKEMFTSISGENLKRLIDGENIRAKSRLSLRPEGTAGVVRAAVQHDLVPQGAPPAKLMYAGPMFRAERPQFMRQRQFNQVGVECLGAEDPTIDAEAIIMLMRFYSEIGIKPESMRLLLNSMGCEKCRPAYRDLVHQYLEEHSDSLCETCRVRMDINPLRAFDCKNAECAKIMEDAPKITDHLCEDCREHYERVKALLDSASIQYIEDASLVRGLDYYTRTVFEVQATSSDSAQNAIGGGGRYDKLAEEVGGRPTPGFGFALGYDRCVVVLQEQGRNLPSLERCDVFCASMDGATHFEAFKLAQMIRNNNRKAEIDHQGRSLKSQFKLADKLGAKLVVIIGPDELEQGLVKVRNMSSHDEQMVPSDEALAYIIDQL